MADESEDESLVDALGEPGPEEKLEDEENIGRNGEQIGLKCTEAERSDVEREIVGRRSLRVWLVVTSISLEALLTFGIVQLRPIR